MADGLARSILANSDLMHEHGLEVPHSLKPHDEQGKHPEV
jgi:hypothetical protein